MNNEFPQQTPALPPHHVALSMKIIMLIFVLVVVGALAWFVWDFKSTPDSADETSVSTTSHNVVPTDWKTYTSTTAYYSFKYPADWTVSAKGGEDPATGTPSFAAPCSYEAGESCLLVDTIVDAGAWTGTLQEYVTQYLAANNASTATQAKTTLGGKEAIKVVFPNLASDASNNIYKVAIYALRDGKGFTLEAVETTKAAATAPKTFQSGATFNILASTFEFTK